MFDRTGGLARTAYGTGRRRRHSQRRRGSKTVHWSERRRAGLQTAVEQVQEAGNLG